MSLASLSPQSASSTHSSRAGSLTNKGRSPPENMVDPQELERRLRAVRDCTPLREDGVDKLKADAQQYYDELVALGGRPTGPIQHYPSCKTTMADSMHHYRDQYETIESIFEVDKCRAVSHWGEEMNKWGDELLRWQRFKECQRVQNRSELDLDLESTDTALVEVLSKLSDWQEFEVFHDRKVYHAEAAYEKCQQRHAANQNAVVAVTSADATPEIQKPYGGWTNYMGVIQKELEDLQERLMWVKSQWTDVIAEACSSIAAAPKLQEELEAKFETQANAIYRCLQQIGARPSRALQSPDINAELPQRIQHWNSEISMFTNELWDWKIFRLWRRRVRDSGNMDQEGQKLLSQGDSCSELFGDLVKYKQQKLDRAISWVNCWRHRARQYMEARKRRLRYNRPRWPAREKNDCDDDDDDEDEDEDDDFYDETEVARAKKAGLYASHAEEKVSVAARMLEESKQKLRDVRAESGPSPTAKYPAIQRLPTPPKSQSPESLPGSRRPSKVREPAGNGHRRMANTNTEQHALPPFASGSNRQKEHDDDIEMSDHTEEPNQADSKDTVMSDVENPPNYSPSPLIESQPRTTANKNHRKLPSHREGHRRSKKERARKGKARVANINTGQHALPPFLLSPNHMEEHNDGIEILDHTEDLDPVEIKKEQNQADPENIVMSDVEDYPSHSPPSPPESQSRPTANKNHKNLPSSSSQSPTSRKTRSSTKLDQVSSGKILKKSSKNKPPKKTKDFTEQQTTALLDIALTSSPSTDPTSLPRNEPESYTKPTANTDHTLPASGSQSPISNYPSTGPASLGRDIPESYPKLTADTDQRKLSPPSSQPTTSSYPSTGATSLGRDLPESYPRPSADTDHSQLSPSSSQISTSSYPSTEPTSLGRNIPESYPKPTADTDHEKLPAPSSQPPMSKKTRLDQVHPGKILKKPSKNKPLKRAAKVVTEASTGPTPPRRSERLKRKAVAALKRPV